MDINELIEKLEEMQNIEDKAGGDGDALRVYCQTCESYIEAVTFEFILRLSPKKKKCSLI
mgnify:CR=1 FL=1